MTVGNNGSYQASVSVTGSGIGPGGGPALQDTQQTTPGGINVPPTDAVTLTAGAGKVTLGGTLFAFALALPRPFGPDALAYLRMVARGDDDLRRFAEVDAESFAGHAAANMRWPGRWPKARC